jgi:molecular chaperone DnaK
VNEAAKHKSSDVMRRELAELRNQAETLLYTTEAALEGYRDLVEAAVLEGLRGDAAMLRKHLDAGADIEAIRTAYQKLEGTTFAIAETLYGGDAPQ